MNYILFGIKYVLSYWISKNTPPLILGLVLHNKCNLRCKHCSIFNRPDHWMSFSTVKSVIDKFYNEGGRCLYLEGGEPFIWKDGKYSVDSIVNYAKSKGFYSITIYTNGLQAINSDANIIFVSMDGIKPVHDQLRGTSFDRITENIINSEHPSLFTNYTINSVNYKNIEDYLEWASSIKNIKGTFFYFHTPYYGYDKLFIDNPLKTEIIHQLIALKKKYSILNSISGLKSSIRNDWKKKQAIYKVYEGGKYFTCCRENNNGETCNVCGYLSYAEIQQTLRLRPGAILNALKYF